MTVAEWLALAKADAEQRGLPDLIPALDGLAKATAQLRAADWNDPSTQSSLSLDDNDDCAHPSTPLGVTLGLSKGQDGHK
jgi:hypothetical protein